MSKLNIIDVLRGGAVPSIEGSIANELTRARIIENLKNKMGPGAEIDQSVINDVLARVQIGGQRGRSIERGEEVASVHIPVDPSLPIDVGYRYRVRIVVQIPDPDRPNEVQTVDKVIPVDSDKQLSRQEIHERAIQAARTIHRNSGSPKLGALGLMINQPTAEVTLVEVISVYRGPLTGP